MKPHTPSMVISELRDRARRAFKTADNSPHKSRRIAAEARADAYLTAAELIRRTLTRQAKYAAKLAAEVAASNE